MGLSWRSILAGALLGSALTVIALSVFGLSGTELKDWQPLMAAVVAICAAMLAYKSTALKIQEDRETERRKLRASVVYGLNQIRFLASSQCAAAKSVVAMVVEKPEIPRIMGAKAAWDEEVKHIEQLEAAFREVSHVFSVDELHAITHCISSLGGIGSTLAAAHEDHIEAMMDGWIYNLRMSAFAANVYPEYIDAVCEMRIHQLSDERSSKKEIRARTKNIEHLYSTVARRLRERPDWMASTSHHAASS